MHVARHCGRLPSAIKVLWKQIDNTAGSSCKKRPYWACDTSSRRTRPECPKRRVRVRVRTKVTETMMRYSGREQNRHGFRQTSRTKQDHGVRPSGNRKDGRLE